MANKIRINCPSCQASLKAPAHLIGKNRDCPRCGFTFEICDPATEGEKTVVEMDAQASTVLISQRDTIDQRLEWPEVKPGQASQSEKLDAEGVRVRDMVTEFVRTVGKPANRPEG